MQVTYHNNTEAIASAAKASSFQAQYQGLKWIVAPTIMVDFKLSQ
jgi:hypothetical protein